MTRAGALEFSRHIRELCARAGKNADDLAPKVGVLPTELSLMIDGWLALPTAVLSALARELDGDAEYLERLAAEVKRD